MLVIHFILLIYSQWYISEIADSYAWPLQIRFQEVLLYVNVALNECACNEVINTNNSITTFSGLLLNTLLNQIYHASILCVVR